MANEINTESCPSPMNTTQWKADFAAYAKMRILIVDDEPANVALLEDMLSDQSYIISSRRLIPARWSRSFAASSIQT